MRAAEGSRLCWVNLALSVAVLWAIPRAADDLHVALAGGRDVLAGRLGAPDDWSFTTSGRVWLDQNWGSHVVLYLAHALGGETGLLVLKAVLCLGVALAVLAACRARGVAGPAPLLVTAGILLAMRTYVDLRPNLLTLLAVPVLAAMLAGAARPAWRAWMATLTLAVWANLHAGFIFGIGMLIAWTACLFAATGLRHGVARGMYRCRPWLLATVVSLALAAFANPFGVVNLTHPFIVARSPVWRNVAEWAPIFGGSRYAAHLSTWELFVALGLLVCACIIRVLSMAEPRWRSVRRLRGERLALVFFDACLVTTAVAMALQSRRFVPLALLAMAPPLAVHGARLLRVLPRQGGMAVSLVLLVPTLFLGHTLAMRYRSDNPLFPPESLFRRMTGSRSFYSAAADFVTTNGVSGRVYNAWKWEGYLRWKQVPLQLFIGARAQQVYDEQTFASFLTIQAAQQSPRVALAALGIHLAVVPMDAESAPFLRAITRELGTPWAYVYADGQWAVVTDGSTPQTAALVANVLAERAWYPDPTVAALSRALYFASPAARAERKQVRAALVAANALRPSPQAYMTLGELTLDETLGMRASIKYLAAEADRLAAMQTDEPRGVDVLYCRRVIAYLLGQLYEASGRMEEASVAVTKERALEGEIRALVRRWGYGET